MTTSRPELGCAHCAKAACLRGERERMPRNCPSLIAAELTADAAPYLEPESASLMAVANDIPFTDDGRLRNRIEEIVAFAQRRNMRRLGIAFCVSLLAEAQRLGELFRAAGLQAELACCRVGAIDHDVIGLPKAHPERFAAICNPVAQARVLDAFGAELIVAMGLCLGHDLMLQAQARAPVTTLVVKDRVVDHHSIRLLRAPTERASEATSPDPRVP